VKQLLDAEFKAWRYAGIELARKPLAEGSVAVVMPFVWRVPEGVKKGTSLRPSQPTPKSSGTSSDRVLFRRDTFQQVNVCRDPSVVEGVFKLLKPGVQGFLEEDLGIMALLGEFLDRNCERYHLPSLQYHDTFFQLQELLLHEVRLDQEQHHLADAARVYGDWPAVIIPALLPFCSAHLTAMERIRGVKVAEWVPAQGLSRQALAKTVAHALIAEPLFSSESAALFHADPHAGNLVGTMQGQLAILDWSLTGRLQRRDRIQLFRLLLGALTLDVGQSARAIEALAQRPPNPIALQEIITESLRAVRWGRFPGLTWMTELLDKLVIKAGVLLSPDLLLFRKTLLTLEGVLTDLVANNSTSQGMWLDQEVVLSFSRRWAAEWPDRLWTDLKQRSLTTHVSMVDLLWLA
jgi:ubiquinone biosynthesis protein